MKIRLHFKPIFYLGNLLLLILGMSSCAVQNHFPLSYYGVNHLDKSKLKLYLIDNEHVLTKVWSMHAMKTHQDEITCRLKPLPESEASQVVMIKNQADAARSEDHVFFFAKPSLIAQIANKDSVTFDYHALDRITVVELDGNATGNKTLKNLAIIPAITFGILFFLLLLLFAYSGN